MGTRPGSQVRQANSPEVDDGLKGAPSNSSVLSGGPVRPRLSDFSPVAFAIVFGAILMAYSGIYLEIELRPFPQRAALILWLYSGVAFAVANVGTLTLAFVYIWARWRDVPRNIRIYLCMIVVAASGVTCFIFSYSSSGGGVPRDLMIGLREIPGFKTVLLVHNLLAVASIATLTIAVVLVTWKIREKESEALGEALQQVRNLMYSSAILLALTVFQLNRLLAAGVESTPAGAPLVGAFSLGTGLVFTLLLFLIFATPSLAAAQRVQELMAAAAKEKDFNKELWLLQNQLPGAPLQHFATVGSILLPLASGLLSESLMSGLA